MIDSDGIGLIFRAKGDTADARRAFDALEKTVKSSVSSAEKNLGGFGSGFNASAMQGAIGAVQSSLSSLGSTIQSVGAQLTVSLTVPLTALATLGIKSALGIDAVRTKITALVGDATKANEKMTELRNLANSSVGVTQTAAFESFAQLKGIGGIADETINKIIASMGKLNAAFKIDDIAGFNQNLNQIFSQGFERSDIKEAIGRVPFFEQLLEQAFGTKDAEKLKQLKDSGKLTLDSFLSGMSGAIDGDSRIANIQENLSVKLAKGAERLNVALAPIGDAILKIIVPALEAAVPYIESMFNWFSKLSPMFQTVIVAIGGFVAALGPALIVIGGVLAAVGSIVMGVAAMGGLVIALKFVGAAILGVIGLFLQFAVVLAAAAGVAVVLYKAWQTNFGGIQEYTVQVWATIKSVVSEAMQFIYRVVQTVGGAIVGWWRENYPLIKQTIETVSNSIKSFIQAFLNTVRGFWESHGAGIMDYVKTYWNVVKGIVSSVMAQIGEFIKFGMQLIQGNWSGAWQTFQNILRNAVKILTQIITGFFEILWKVLKAAVPIILDYGKQIYDAMVFWIAKAVLKVGAIIEGLPDTLRENVPKLYQAGLDLANAILQGIADAFKTKGDIAVPVKVYDGSADSQGVISKTQTTATTQGDADAQIISTSGGSGSTGDADKRRKEREEAQKQELADRISLLQKHLSDAASEYDKAFEKIKETFAQDGNIQAFADSVNGIGQSYLTEVKAITDELTRLENEQSDKEKQSVSRKQAIVEEQNKRIADADNKLAERKKESENLVTENQKKSSEKRTAQTQSELKNELSLREAAMATVNARNEKDVALGIVTEKEAFDAKQKMEGDYLLFKLENLEKQRALFVKGSEEEKQITQEINLFKEEIDRRAFERGKEAADFRKRDAEEEKRNAQELLDIRKQVLAAEKQILDFRAAQTRKRLENSVENSSGKDRIRALTELRDFEIAEENRKNAQRTLDLEAEKTAALERVKGKENEEALKAEIEKLYKEKALFSEQEFQEKLKEIRDSFNPQIEQSEAEEGQGSFLGGVFGSITSGMDASIVKLTDFSNVVKQVGSTVGDVFMQMGKAVGSMVQQWVLMGNAAGFSMRKMVASTLAGVAAQAATLAVFHVAMGIAALTPWGAALYGNPILHFKAAALWGAISVGTALLGRGVAGNAFKNETNDATGGSGGGSSSGGSGNQSGGAFSGQSNQIIEQGRNSPFGRSETMVVTVKDRTGGTFASLFEMEIQNNTRLRSLIQEAANG